MSGTVSIRNFVKIDEVVQKLVEFGLYTDTPDVHGVKYCKRSFLFF
jgi:hypothetical protein